MWIHVRPEIALTSHTKQQSWWKTWQVMKLATPLCGTGTTSASATSLQTASWALWQQVHHYIITQSSWSRGILAARLETSRREQVLQLPACLFTLYVPKQTVPLQPDISKIHLCNLSFMFIQVALQVPGPTLSEANASLRPQSTACWLPMNCLRRQMSWCDH